MLSLNETFDDSRAIKVLVVPIGENSFFEEHFDVISRVNSLQLYELTKPSTWKLDNKALKHFNWNKGDIKFDFLRYDRIPNSAGDLDNYQSSKRVLMIMGLINYPELGKYADKITEELDYFNRRYPSILLRKCFIFNYVFDSSPLNNFLPKSPTSDPNLLIVFPPEGKCNEGGVSMIEVHLQEVMTDAVVKIIISLEQQLVICEENRIKNTIPATISLSTIYDELDEASNNNSNNNNNNSISVSRDSFNIMSTSTKNFNNILAAPANANTRKVGSSAYKKKPLGRLKKWMGDISLQVCSPIDAIDHYNTAIQECRNNNDSLWLAGALEGYVTAILLLIKLGISLEDTIGKELKAYSTNASQTPNPELEEEEEETVITTDAMKAIPLLEDRVTEALAIYAKNVVYCTLEVELVLKLGRMYEGICIKERNNPGFCFDVRYFEIQQKIMNCILHAASIQGLNAQQEIECTIEGGLIFHRLGLNRKYGLFLYVAALMSAENDQMHVAHSLLQHACAQYNVDGSHSINYQEPYTEGLTRDSGSVWNNLYRALYAHSAYVGNEIGDTVSAARNIASLLQVMMGLTFKHSKDCSLLNHSVPQIHKYILETSSNKGAGSVFGRLSNLGELNGLGKATPRLSISNYTLRNSSSTSDDLSDAIQTPPSVYNFNKHKHPQASIDSNPGPAAVPKMMISVPKIMSNIFNKSKEVIKKRINNSAGMSKHKKLVGKKKSHGSSVQVQSKRVLVPRPNDKSTSAASTKSDSGVAAAVLGVTNMNYVSVEQQEQAVDIITTITREIPPAFSLELPITFLGMKLLLLPSTVRPKLLAADITNAVYATYNVKSGAVADGNTNNSGNVKSSSLYYDPFAAKKEKERPLEIIWAVGYTSRITAYFINPLSVAIKLDTVTVIAEGVEHQSFPITVEIPANSENYEVDLSILPKAEGVLKVTGLQMFMNNAKYKVYIDEKGFVNNKLSKLMRQRGTQYSPSTVNVTTGCPILQVYTSGDTLKSIDQQVQHISLLPGESRNEVITLQREHTSGEGVNDCQLKEVIGDLSLTIHECINGIKKTYSICNYCACKDSTPVDAVMVPKCVKFKDIKGEDVIKMLNEKGEISLPIEIVHTQGVSSIEILVDVIPDVSARSNQVPIYFRQVATIINIIKEEGLQLARCPVNSFSANNADYLPFIEQNLGGVSRESIVVLDEGKFSTLSIKNSVSLPVYFGCNELDVNSAVTKSAAVTNITNGSKLKVSELLATTFLVPSSIFSNVILDLDVETPKDCVFHFGYMNRYNKLRKGTVSLSRTNQSDSASSYFRRSKVEYNCIDRNLRVNNFIELCSTISLPDDHVTDRDEYSVEVIQLVMNQDTKNIAKDCIINGKCRDVHQLNALQATSSKILQLRKSIKLLFSKSGTFLVFTIIKSKHNSASQPVSYCYLGEPYIISV